MGSRSVSLAAEMIRYAACGERDLVALEFVRHFTIQIYTDIIDIMT